MVVVDRSFSGSAAQATLMTAMTPSSPSGGGTITVSDDSGYPTSGKFEIVIDRATESEENVLISSRAGTTFTIGQRGYDGSVARTHTSGVALVEHDLSGRTVQLFVDHVDDVESDPHSTKLLNNTRHDLETRHTFGAAYGTPVTPTALTPDIAGTAGTGNNPSREDHVHNVPAGTPGSILPDDVAAEGAAATFARADHTHGVTAAAATGLGTANSEGVATSFARSDHVHGSTAAVQVFTSGGTWTKPAGLRFVRVRLVGGGGGSGGVAATGGNSATAGGGGGGGYAEEIIATGSLSATEVVTIGAGGSAGASGANAGGTGGTTSFGSHCQATGGGGGLGGPAVTDGATAGGNGGSGSGGAINTVGSDGGLGLVTGGITIRNGDGGASQLGCARLQNSTVSSNGEAGLNYGGGASGALNGASAGAKTGAAGAGGVVIVEEFI